MCVLCVWPVYTSKEAVGVSCGRAMRVARVHKQRGSFPRQVRLITHAQFLALSQQAKTSSALNCGQHAQAHLCIS
eukprot:scaffold261922_cov19-Tisochrysis_lutea.AAC.1